MGIGSSDETIAKHAEPVHIGLIRPVDSTAARFAARHPLVRTCDRLLARMRRAAARLDDDVCGLWARLPADLQQAVMRVREWEVMRVAGAVAEAEVDELPVVAAELPVVAAELLRELQHRTEELCQRARSVRREMQALRERLDQLASPETVDRIWREFADAGAERSRALRRQRLRAARRPSYRRAAVRAAKTTASRDDGSGDDPPGPRRGRTTRLHACGGADV